MYHFFVGPEQITETHIYVTGEDYNHAANVLRLRAGEEVLISDEAGQDYLCAVEEIVGRDAQKASGRKIQKESGKNPEEIQPEGEENGSPLPFLGEPHLRLVIRERRTDNHELPARVWLFQGLPKSDKMEWIVQKATELGVTDIVPVDMKNCVVKLDEKKAEARRKRLQAIAESAAKQSKRSRIPVVHPLKRFTEVMRMADELDVKILPYEEENGILGMCESIVSFLPGRNIAVVIGPEGGFDPMEVKLAKSRGFRTVSLGRRILRTETAALAVLSMIMIRLEIAAEIGFEAEP